MEILFIDDRGERSVSGEDLPQAIGGPNSVFHLDSMNEQRPSAWLAADQGALFIQTADNAPHAVSCNGVQLSASRWLEDGDLLAIGSSRIAVTVDGHHATFTVDSAQSQLQPPPVAARGTPASPTTVSPVDFTPQSLETTRRRRLPVRPIALLLGFVLLLAATAVWFVVTARSVVVVITPEPDRMELQGGLFTPRIGDSYLVRPGIYTVIASKAGHCRLEEEISVGDQARQTFSLELVVLPGTLSVSTGELEGAEVIVDGTPFGATPLRDVEIAAGLHHLVVRAPRHVDHEATFTVIGSGKEHIIEVDLQPTFSAVTLSTDPAGATVLVDGSRVGTTPLALELDAGTHIVEYVLAGYNPHSSRIRVAEGEHQTLPVVHLQAAEGNLTVRSEPPSASVTVDGEYRGTSPLQLSLSPGREHQIKLSLAGHGPWSRAVTMRPGERQELTATLPPLLGTVRVISRPEGAELLVDGVPSGRTGQLIELSTVPHTIEVRSDGFVSHTSTVTPRADLATTVEVELEAEHTEAVLVPVVTTSEQVEMRLIPPGRFQMGASRREPGRRANETLRHVELTRPFYMAVREVSNREFRRFKESHLSGGAASENLEIDHHPAVRVSWDDAARYCNWLSARESLPEVYRQRNGTMVARSPMPSGYRLPTEAEWAWAARYDAAGVAHKYAWGDELPIPEGAGNYGDTSASRLLGSTLPDYNDGRPSTAPVGSYRANARGLYNTGGNVAEWVNDFYAIHLPTPGEAGKDPMGPPDGDSHVIRGAGWMDTSATELRLSYRDYGSKPRPDVGFRVARFAD